MTTRIQGSPAPLASTELAMDVSLRAQPPAGPKNFIGDALSRPLADFYLVLVSAGLLVGLGVMMVLSSSSAYAANNDQSVWYYVLRQVAFLVFGLPLMWWLSRRSEQFLGLFGWVILMGAVVAELLVLFTSLGYDAGKGNKNWLNLHWFTIQPSEFAKVGLVVWAASVLANRKRTIDQPKRLLFPLLLGFGVVVGLVLMGGDLGTTIIICAILLALLWFVGTPIWLLASMVITAGAGVVVMIMGSSYRRARIAAFLNHAGATSDQPQNAIYGLATGGWWGLGLWESRQKWGGLADGALNDYVFAVLGEELGLIGSLTVIALFLVLGYAGLRVALRSTSTFYRLASAGVTAWLLLQAIINIAMVMKLLPVVGVPLPFISYGGSALVANLIGLGVLLSAARHEPDALAIINQYRTRANRPRVISVVDVHSR